MKNIASARDHIAKVHTAMEYLNIPDNYDKAEAYNIALKGFDALQESDITVCNLLANLDDEDITENLISNHDASEGNMKTYGEYIKRGASILTIDGELDSDVNTWDMDRLATIGLNTDNPQVIEGKSVTFDGAANLWIDTDGIEYPYSTDTGMPVTAQ